MSLHEKIYWAMPYHVKCWMASQGAKRQSKLRFSDKYESLKIEISKRNQWPEADFRRYQLSYLKDLADHCAAHVPYYRDLFRKIGFETKGIESFADFREIPILEKEEFRERSTEFVDERLELSTLLKGETSGTTGTPLTIYRSRLEFSAAFAYNAVRHWSVAGVERRLDRSVSIGGALVVSPQRTKPPFWVLNKSWKQLYMSSYHLTWENMKAYVRAIRTYQPSYVEGYPSSVHAIATYMIETGEAPIPLNAVFTTAENLMDFQREAIRAAFTCETYSQYGCTEQVVYAAECQSHSMHLSLDHSYLEILTNDGTPCPPLESGNVIGTSLIRYSQPLLRYRVGDMASLGSKTCSCGSSLPILARVEGRKDDVLVTPDGRRIGRLDTVFKGVANIREAQIIQDRIDLFRVRIVPGDGFSADDSESVKKNLSNRTGGDAIIQIELVSEISRTSSGKFRSVISNIQQ